MLETMKKVRDNDLEIDKANAVSKAAKELVQLGRLEIEVERTSKD